MVHAKMYSTIQKSALSQQINKTFSLQELRKASPSTFTSETRKCHGKRQYRAQEGRMAINVSGRGRRGEVSGTQRVTVGGKRADHG